MLARDSRIGNKKEAGQAVDAVLDAITDVLQGGGDVNFTGKTARAFIVQKADGSVKGAVFAGHGGARSLLFTKSEHLAKHASGCDHSG